MMPASSTPFGAAALFGSAATALASLLTRAVVQVRSHDTGSGGAGLIWGAGASGLIVTNAHCVPNGAAIEVCTDGRWREARVIAYHPPHDLALLASSPVGAPPLAPRDAESLRPGELLFAHGHPLGVRDALAMGVLRDVARDRRTGAPRWIVADVRLAPGNSGGPLVDADGRLVGINSMVVNGLGVAVPAALVQQFIDRVIARRAA